MMRRVAVFVLAIASIISIVGGAEARTQQTTGCPSAQRCRLYKVRSTRFPAVRGAITIHYQLGHVQPWLTPKELLVAAQEAERAWESANPNVRFIMDGMSTELPVLGNEINEIAWTLLDPDVLSQTNLRSFGSRMLEADTLLNVAKPWGWGPCGGDFGACSDSGDEAGVRLLDVQAMLTHTFGRWLGLEPLMTAAARDLTMYVGFAYGERHKSTLGLGDVLGVRAAYPCGRCRMARVITP